MNKLKTLYAVIGNPISHSKSPQIHNYFASITGITQTYEKILSTDTNFIDTINNFVKRGGIGLNITVPFKQKVFDMIEKNKLSEDALFAGAVNTMHFKNNYWYGYNTDGQGLINDLVRLNFELNKSKILLIGAGGAARGIIISIIKFGCKRIHIVNRSLESAKILAENAKKFALLKSYDIDITHGELSSSNIELWPLVINTTSSSLQNEFLNIPKNIFTTNSIAYDLYYSNKNTTFLEQAKIMGAHICSDGLGMLVEQAAESFYIWHGLRPDTNLTLSYMRNHLML